MAALMVNSRLSFNELKDLLELTDGNLASLVKALEDFGIGRPSTYASIIQTLVRRKYVDMDRRRFIPTDTGMVVARFLENHFEPYVDYDFTARMEDTLDEISRGEMHWIPPLMQFWKPFIRRIEEKQETVSRQEAKATRVLGTDPKTGKELWRTKYGQAWGSPVAAKIGDETAIFTANGRILRASDGKQVARGERGLVDGP